MKKLVLQRISGELVEQMADAEANGFMDIWLDDSDGMVKTKLTPKGKAAYESGEFTVLNDIIVGGFLQTELTRRSG